MNLPNKLTTIRMGLVVIIIALLLFPYQIVGVDTIPIVFGAVNLVYFIAAIIFVLAAFTDFLDGYLARKHNLITNYGKFMDPIADKLLVNSLLIILIFPNRDIYSYQAGISVFLVVVMIGRDIVVDGFRLVAASQNKVLAANIFGKVKTVLQIIAIILYLLNDFPFSNQIHDSAPPIVSYVVLLAATIVSVISGIIYLYQNRSVLKDSV